MTWKLKPESNKKKADIKPTANPESIVSYWDRDAPVYHSLIVKQVKRTGNKLQFAIWNHETGELSMKNGKPYSINLGDYLSAMNELPSSVTTATAKKPFGLLFVTEDWAKANNVNLRDGGTGGGKFPRVLAF